MTNPTTPNIHIKYKRIKHGYVRCASDGSLHLSIPRIRRFDPVFKQRLLQQGQRLLHKQTLHTAQHHKENANHVRIRGVAQEKANLPQDIEQHLHTLCIQASKEFADVGSAQLGIAYERLRVRRLRSKRGSCSGKQNISINLDLIHLPQECLRYVVMHEVAHLKHKHHQKSFRDEVARLCPDYLSIKKRLRDVRFFPSHERG